MFNTYLRLIARYITWLEQRFPEFMFARRNTFRHTIAKLLVAPGIIILIIVPLSLIALGILHLPVSDNMRAMLLFFAGFLFIFTLLRKLIKELKKNHI